VGDLEMTKALVVADDPRIDISSADRKAQHDALIDLHYLNPYVTAASKAVDDLNKQLENVQKTLKKVSDVPEVITEHIKTMSGELKELKTKISGDPSLGTRGRRSSVQGVLSMLGSAIGGYSEAPTSRQLQRIEEKRSELRTLIDRINKIIQSDIPRLNELLIGNDIPHVFPVKIIKFKQ
jgi:flagellar biosynthesis chaperone FliJ